MEKLVFLNENGIAMMSSRTVGKLFKKQHKNVLRSIRDLHCSKEFTDRNFVVSEYKDSYGRKMTEIQMTKEGYSFLCMSFTSKKGASFAEPYAEEFDKLQREMELLKN